MDLPKRGNPGWMEGGLQLGAFLSLKPQMSPHWLESLVAQQEPVLKLAQGSTEDQCFSSLFGESDQEASE